MRPVYDEILDIGSHQFPRASYYIDSGVKILNPHLKNRGRSQEISSKSQRPDDIAADKMR